jgi:HD-GYP domain-containing protein (c-di-GMP phosphodiesterase class II)
MYREIPVSQLKFGMFVVQLDRPWTETPFTFQGFLLKTDRQMELLQQLCKKVYVDPERSDAGTVAIMHATGTISSARPEQVRGDTSYAEKASVEAELPAARAAYAETRALIEDMIRAVQIGNVIEGPKLREAVSRVTDSIVRNPDAMMLLTRMMEKSSQVASRALDVSIYMLVFGRFLQLPRERLDTLGLLGLLQDIGKVKLPNELLDKRGKLNAAELKVARTHVQLSAEVLRNTPGLPPDLAALALLHHERHDGSGYPKGLKGAEIGLVGSIAGIVDTFDALTMPRPYAEQMSPSNALNLLFKGRGAQFHPALVEQFIQCIGVFPVGAVVELNTGEIGVVIAQNLVRRLQPRVMVIMDAEGRPLRPHKILDLVKEPKASPDEPYRIRRTLEHGKVEIDPREFFL